MSTVIQPFIDRLNKIQFSIERVARNIVVQNQETIIGILQQNQLSQGLDSYQKVVGWYAPSTVNIYAKDPHNKPRTDKVIGSPYNFEWQGQLFDTMQMKIEQDGDYTIFSSTGKIKFLEKIYKRKLGDLSEQNNTIVNMEIILPKLREYLLNEMFKGLI